MGLVKSCIYFLFFTHTVLAISLEPHVIYGDDDRKDIYDVTDRVQLDLARSSVALIPKSNLTKGEGGLTAVESKTLGEAMSLCEGEPFFSQPSGAVCSGFLVGEDLIATAGHCISEANCEDMTFVFDYQVAEPGKMPTSVPTENVYSCKKIESWEFTRKQDYALVRIDRRVKGRTPMNLRSYGAARTGDPLLVIGHPSGVPTKIAGGAKVRELKSGFFRASLDTYGGNSGSAVLNSRTMVVEGILVRGETDYNYDYKKGCRNSNICEQDGCRGEDVTLIRFVVDALVSKRSAE